MPRCAEPSKDPRNHTALFRPTRCMQIQHLSRSSPAQLPNPQNAPDGERHLTRFPSRISSHHRRRSVNHHHTNIILPPTTDPRPPTNEKRTPDPKLCTSLFPPSACHARRSRNPFTSTDSLAPKQFPESRSNHRNLVLPLK